MRRFIWQRQYSWLPVVVQLPVQLVACVHIKYPGHCELEVHLQSISHNLEFHVIYQPVTIAWSCILRKHEWPCQYRICLQYHLLVLASGVVYLVFLSFVCLFCTQMQNGLSNHSSGTLNHMLGKVSCSLDVFCRMSVVSHTSRFAYIEVVSPTQPWSIRILWSCFADNLNRRH